MQKILSSSKESLQRGSFPAHVGCLKVLYILTRVYAVRSMSVDCELKYVSVAVAIRTAVILEVSKINQRVRLNDGDYCECVCCIEKALSPFYLHAVQRSA